MGLREEMRSYVEQYEAEDAARDKVIKTSRDILRPAKQAIYALHRGEPEEAEKLIAQAEESLREASAHAERLSDNETGSLRNALEELAEAKAYRFILKENRLPSKKDLGLDLSIELYLRGLADCSGEMVRRAVQAATDRNIETVKRMAALVEELYGHFLLFDFRGGEVRKKSDMLRHNLNKIQQIVYEVSM